MKVRWLIGKYDIDSKCGGVDGLGVSCYMPLTLLSALQFQAVYEFYCINLCILG